MAHEQTKMRDPWWNHPDRYVQNPDGTVRVVSFKTLRARQSRAELVIALGSKCNRCPKVTDLQFDCIVRQGPAHHLMSWPDRIRFYWAQHLANNIQLLCADCHLLKTQAENHKARGALPHPDTHHP